MSQNENFWVGKSTVQYKGGCIAVDAEGNAWRCENGKPPVKLMACRATGEGNE